ncbi:MAG: type II secretion system protein [Candidatus Moraniibacteriota bacterium]
MKTIRKKRNLKNAIKEKKGFTLVELLLVIAIIGILAGTIIVGISGQRNRARVASSIESLRSAMPYVVECYMNYGETAVNSPVVDNPICSEGAGDLDYPGLDEGCDYTGITDGKIEVECTGGDTVTIVCDFTGEGNCVQQ